MELTGKGNRQQAGSGDDEPACAVRAHRFQAVERECEQRRDGAEHVASALRHPVGSDCKDESTGECRFP
jgi:hypothetical protein